MFKFNELKHIHLEITNNCQASCPMCSRNDHGGQTNPLININSWTLKSYTRAMSDEVLRQIKTISFCGNFGDPLLNNDLLAMVNYTVSVNCDIEIRIHTNGSLRSSVWWSQLAAALPVKHVVVFAIDGLVNTHSIYRIGTDYNQIIKNATHFINAGGNAEWAFIRFAHNAHEVSDAREIAMQLGFKNFVMKDSSRFLMTASFEVVDRNGLVVNTLSPAAESKITFINKKDIENYKSIVEHSIIECYALQNKEIYIDAFGLLFPCCWIASTPYNYDKPSSQILTVKQEILRQYHTLVADLGGISNIDTSEISIKDIVNSHKYQTVWDKYWNNEKLITCARTCGVNKFSKPSNQFITRERVNE
jgi:MoaA/NifB/PqqE/SkfB family radical SAM enzyme